MGSCMSTGGGGGGMVVEQEQTNGGGKEFQSKYVEDDVLGQGEFGIVKKVFEQYGENGRPTPFACKYLKKGVQFKDNVVYPPMKPEILRAEIEMLRSLGGQNYCLKLCELYESPKMIMMVTELCKGGEMMEWVSGQQQDLRTENVSRIAYQMLSAVNHCAKHNIIHRDIKAENVLFKERDVSSEMRLIDFGAGTNRPSRAATAAAAEAANGDGKKQASLDFHTTFAGSAFYISPEMFQHTYNSKTDVWSVGVTLYVLVAGFPADCLQTAFNLIHKAKDRNLRELPNLPENMPQSYVDMLDELLQFKQKKRKTAGEMLNHKFVRFHLDLINEDKKIAQQEKEQQEQLRKQQQEQQQKQQEENNNSLTPSTREEMKDDVAPLQGDCYIPNQSLRGSNRRKRQTTLTKQSVFFAGSVRRHSQFLDYVKFERSLTTLLATVLPSNQFEQLVSILNERYGKKTDKKGNNKDKMRERSESHRTQEMNDEGDSGSDSGASQSMNNNTEKLDVVQIDALKDILENDIKNRGIISMIASLKDAELYDNFAYDISRLRDFTTAARAHPLPAGGGGGNVNEGSFRGRVSGLMKGRSMNNLGGGGGGRSSNNKQVDVNASHKPFGRMQNSAQQNQHVDSSVKSVGASLGGRRGRGRRGRLRHLRGGGSSGSLHADGSSRSIEDPVVLF